MMLTRNGSKAGTKRHTQRLKNMANAEIDFIGEVEENTNFMMPVRGNRRRGTTQSKSGRATTTKTMREHVPNILSQVRKYGIEDSIIPKG